MSWTYHESMKDDAEFLRQFIAFLQSCISQRRDGSESIRPEFVPDTIEVPTAIVSQLPAVFRGVISPGIHSVSSNQWGAISASDGTGRLMGIRPHEYVVMSMCPNPHLKRNQGDD